jgi:chromosome segregation ATPase
MKYETMSLKKQSFKELSDLENKKQDKIAEINGLEQEKKRILDSISNAEFEHTKDLEKMERIKGDLTKQSYAIRSSCDELRHREDNLKKDMEHIDGEIKKKQDELVSLEQQNEVAKIRYERSLASLEELEEKKKSLHDSCITLEEEKKNKTKELQDITEKATAQQEKLLTLIAREANIYDLEKRVKSLYLKAGIII